MNKPMTATTLRAKLFKTLDRVVGTGEPVEVEPPSRHRAHRRHDARQPAGA